MNEHPHVDAYPLAWPDGWRRTSAERRTRAKFRGSSGGWSSDHSYRPPTELTIAQGIARVLRELGAMGCGRDDVVISSNLRLRLDGLPRSDQREPSDPGVAVYWQRGRERRCMAVDRYDRVADNLGAIAATLEAMRAIDRHGGAEILERAFTGFVALPQPEQWFQVLGISSRATRDEIDAAYRRLAMTHHPDRGGDASEMSRINAARDRGYEETQS